MFNRFITDADVARMSRPDSRERLTQCLVRTGSARFICSAQDIAHLERCLVAGGDHIRDVSIETTTAASHATR